MAFRRVSIRELWRAASNKHGKAALAVAEDVFKQLAQTPAPKGTPVLSGFHAGSWQLTVNKISKRVASRKLKAIGKREGRRTIPPPPTPQIDRRKLKSGDTIHLTNHADVIVGLNQGVISKKSPAGFVERAVASANARASSIYRDAIGD